MSTIRPLATIAVLAALGVYLAVKINEGPVVAVDDSWGQPTEAGAAGGEPPAWNAAPTTPAEGVIETPTPVAPEAVPVPQTASNTLAVPPLPALPPAAPPAPGATTTSETLALPDNIPQANYSGAPAATPPAGITGSVPSLGASAAVAPTAPATSEPSPFDAAWEAVQATLERGQLPQAHLMLSQWRGSEDLSPAQQQEVETLLGQLAGTVVYSTNHGLEPPHVVAPGETLATIAQQYQVPWQLLAKINGVASAEAVQPGQTLKVVRGPFDAEVDLKRGELVVLLEQRYAGKFPVRVEGAAPGAGAWKVGQKKLDSDPLGLAAEQKVVLENPAGQRLELSSSPMPAAGAGRLTIASGDLADLYDILSIGSEVTILR